MNFISYDNNNYAEGTSAHILIYSQEYKELNNRYITAIQCLIEMLWKSTIKKKKKKNYTHTYTHTHTHTHTHTYIS